MPKYRWEDISKYNPKELFTNSIFISTGYTVRKGVEFLMKNNDLPDISDIEEGGSSCQTT